MFGPSGNCGERVRYSLNQSTFTLTISGNGKMNDYSRKDKAPWNSYKDFIRFIVIEDGVTSIGSRAFDNCKKLTYINIPNSVTQINCFAFCYCIILTSLKIPCKVNFIGNGAFSHCHSLTSILIDDNNKNYKFINGVLFTKDVSCLHTYLISNGALSYTVPDTVKTIKDWAFDSCKCLMSLTLTINITEIGAKAFSGCENLVCYLFDPATNKLVIYGEGEIQNCPYKNVESVIIRDGIRSIGSDAFNNCNNLTSITIASTVKKICDHGLFCNNLTNVTYLGNTEPVNNGIDVFNTTNSPLEVIVPESYECDSFCNKPIKKAGSCGKNAIYFLNESNDVLTISGNGKMGKYLACEEEDFSYGMRFCDGPWTTYDNSNTITTREKREYPPYARHSNNIKAVIIKDGITRIGHGAFSLFPNLKSVDISSTVTNIGALAFNVCENLSSIVIPNSVVSIKYLAFHYCKNLTNIIIPDSVEIIYFRAFSNCKKLASVMIKNNETIIENNAFEYCENLTFVSIANGIKKVGPSFFDKIFEGCPQLKSVLVPNNFKLRK